MADDPTQSPPSTTDIAKAQAGQFLTVENLTRVQTVGVNIVTKAVEAIVSLVLPMLGTVAAAVAEGMIKGEAAADDTMKRLAELAIKDVFGVDVSVGGAGPGKGGGARKDASRAIGKAILDAVGGVAAAGATGQLTPSAAAAEKYITTAANIALEGWLQGIMGELMSLGAVENLGDLDDAFSGVLGLGRVSSRVLSPLVDTTVVGPFEWQINKTYRPRLYSVSQAIGAFMRGEYTAGELTEELARQGWSDARIKGLVADAMKRLTKGEVSALYRTGYVNEEFYRAELKAQGYDADTAERIFRADVADDELALNRSLASVATAAYAAGDITSTVLEQYLALAYPNTLTRQAARGIADAKRALAVKRISSSDVAAAVKRKIATMSDYRAALAREGYPPEDVLIKELLLSDVVNDEAEIERAREAARKAAAEEKIRKAAEAAQKAADRAAGVKIGPAPVSVYTRAVVRGILPSSTLRGLLEQEKYSTDEITAIVSLAEEDRAAYVADRDRRAVVEAQLARKQVSLSKLEEGVRVGALSMQDYAAGLTARGVADAERDLLVDILAATIAARQAAEQLRAERDAELRRRGVSLGAFEQLVLRGLRTSAHYADFLEEQGFSPVDAATLRELLDDKVSDLLAADERRREVEAELRTRAISLAQLEAAVVAGVRTVDDYQAALLAAGYDADDQLTLTRLLAHKLAQLEAARARRRQIDEQLARQQISLATIERAVKLGVRNLDHYRAWLEARGYDADDRAILVDVLVADLAELRAVEEKRRQVDAARADRALSLAQIERAVRSGLETVGGYAGAVAARGFDARETEILVGLLELRLAQDAAARERRAAIEADLGTRDLSLAKWDAAVKAGLRSFDDYAAFLADQGYDDEAIALVLDLLAFQLEGAS